jgi:hypothetical protein
VSKLHLFCLIAAASFFGVLCSNLLCRSTAFRDAAGRLFGHGRLIAITDSKGVYERDLDDDDFSTASDLVAMENLCRVARNEPLAAAKVDGELSLLRAQFGDEKAFLGEVRANVFSISSLRERIAEQVRRHFGATGALKSQPMVPQIIKRPIVAMPTPMVCIRVGISLKMIAAKAMVNGAWLCTITLVSPTGTPRAIATDCARN